jgi:hypothetical protein
MQRTTRREVSLARQERLLTNSGVYLNSALSLAITSKNSRIETLAAQGNDVPISLKRNRLGAVKAQSTLTSAYVAFFGSKRSSDTNPQFRPPHHNWAKAELRLQSSAGRNFAGPDNLLIFFGFFISSLSVGP